MLGDFLELRYREKAYGYFGGMLRRAQAVSLGEVEEQLEAHLTDRALDALRLADVTVRGRAKQAPGNPEVCLVVEVSNVMDQNDVLRAQRRAALLHKACFVAVPVVVGERATWDAEQMAERQHVVLLQNDGAKFWQDALQSALEA
jgi:hypothetical protein